MSNNNKTVKINSISKVIEEPSKVNLNKKWDLSSKPLHKYKFKHSIDQGGMKRILQVKDIDTARDIAMAVLLSHNTSENDKSRFIKEARITATLEHPNIVPVHDIGIDKAGVPYFTMKLLEGDTLSNVLKKLNENDSEYRKRHTSNSLLWTFQRICNAIEFAHSKGIIHLDLKPENIQLGHYGEVLVLDWGLAKVLGEEDIDDAGDVSAKETRMIIQQDIEKTLDGITKGTPGYMAPEQAEGKNSVKDKRTDIYALGAILYSLLTYQKPIEGNTPKEILSKTINGEIIELKKRSSNVIYTTIEAVVRKAMALNPDDRYQSVNKLLKDVIAFRDGKTTEAEHASTLKIGALFFMRHKIISVATSLVIMLSLTLGFSLFTDYLQQQSGWKKVYEEDFTLINPNFKNLSIMDKTLSKKQPIVWNYTSKGLQITKNTWIIFNDINIKNDTKVIAYISYNDKPDAFQVCMNSRIESIEHWWQTPKGYAFQFGGYSGSKNLILKSENNLKHEIIGIAQADIDLDQEYKVVFEHKNNILSMYVNNNKIISTENIFPLNGKNLNNLMITSFSSSIRLKKIQVYRLAIPLKASPLIAGETLNESGYYLDAIEKYFTIAENYKMTHIAKIALISAYKIAITKLNDNQARDKYLGKIRIALTEYPFYQYAADILEMDAISLWKLKKYQTALSKMPEIIKYKPNSKIALQFLHYKYDDIPNNTKITLLKWLAKIKDLKRLNISDLGLSTIAPLANTQLTMLDCSNNNLTSLASLKKMKSLEILNCSNNNISNLEPLKNLINLKDLNIANNINVKELSCLVNLPLYSLDISSTEVKELKSIINLPINSLYIYNCEKIKTLSKIKNIKSLEYIGLSNTRKDIHLLQSYKNLQYISFSYNEKQSITAFWKNFQN